MSKSQDPFPVNNNQSINHANNSVLFSRTVNSCGIVVNASLTSQEYNITSSAEAEFCRYIVASQPGSGVEVTIAEGFTSGDFPCGSVSILCKYLEANKSCCFFSSMYTSALNVLLNNFFVNLYLFNFY